jgi:7-cyano-7-deazaguanine synthase
VCLISGGPDSIVAAALAARRGSELCGLFADYGQRTLERELDCAKRNAGWLGMVDFKVARIPWLSEVGGSALTDLDMRVSQADPGAEYVPFRNTLLISHAVAWAEVLGAELIVIGSTGGPWITPDNNIDYFEAMKEVIARGSRVGARLDIYAPLCQEAKVSCIQQALDLGVPLENTWSCQNDNDKACAECNNCLDRAAAFAALGLADPVISPGQPE